MLFDDAFPHPMHQIQAPRDLSPSGVRAWLTEICELAQTTPTTLAKEAGLAPSTINKFLAAKDDDKKNLGATTIGALRQAATIRYLDRVGGGGPPHTRNGSPTKPAYTLARVAGDLERDVFQESVQLQPEDQALITIPLFSAVPGDILAFRVRDDHALPIYPKNTVLVARGSLPEVPPSPGSKLIVSRRNDTGAVEITVRRFLVSPSNDAWLVATTHRAERPPDVYLGKSDDPSLFRQRQSGEYTPEAEIVVAIVPQLEFDELQPQTRNADE